ncbi:CD209 antigen-like protein C [Conger conger]|uniref:CD209 antigen-like protein C n=1 Tax=Conger conger TaxID=82655 RepID=UPI002A5AE8F9|nr:CD209 antigen-like protein C [Conger conger]
MDSDGYDRFNGPEQQNNRSSEKTVLYRGRRFTLTDLLNWISLLLLLLLLLIMGLKFTQVQQEVADIKLLLVSINLSLVEPLSRLAEAEAQMTDLIPSHQKPMAPMQGPCDEGWLFFQGSCYLLSSDRLSWHDAEKICEDQGAQLFVINNADELDFIEGVMFDTNYWIGLVERAEEGHWSWVDGTNFLTTPHFWDVGQPDEWDYPANGEDCGELRINLRPRWNDADCSLRVRYICELKGK